MAGRTPALLGVVRFGQPGTGLVVGTYVFVVVGWAVVALRPGVGPPAWEQVVQLGGSVLFAVATVLQLRTRVRADVDGIHARDQLGRSRRLAWSQVSRFDVRGSRRALGAWTVDGRWIRLMTFGGNARRAAACRDELETYRRAREQALRHG